MSNTIRQQRIFDEPQEVAASKALRNDKYTDYETWLAKFSAANAKTTDDCYTPRKVYDAALSFVDEEIIPLEGRDIIRPFYPGGDYQNTEYPEGCIVIDNPPFSIFTKIVRFYMENGIRFFLFAPALTVLNATLNGVTAIITDAHIVYENGAKVPTSFLTSLTPAYAVVVSPSLTTIIREANTITTKKIRRIKFPKNLTSGARLHKLANGGADLRIMSSECQNVAKLDSGYSIFGKGLYLSDAAAERVAAAERAYQKYDEVLTLSPREHEIIRRLNEQSR